MSEYALLQVEVTFGEAGDVIPYYFQDMDWQSPNYEDWPEGQPEEVNDDGLWGRHARLPEAWAGIIIQGFPAHNNGIGGYPNAFYAEEDMVGRSGFFDEDFGCLAGYGSDIVAIAKRTAKEAVDAYLASEREQRRDVTDQPKPHTVILLLVCRLEWAETSYDWETGHREYGLQVEILGPLDFGALPIMACPELATRWNGR